MFNFMLSPSSISKTLASRVQAALGKRDCDWVLKNARYLDVFSCEWREGDIGICEGAIVSLTPGLKAKRTFDLRGKWVVPGFIDAHVHVESSLLLPGFFQNLVLPRGTTSAICDPHELANVRGIPGIQYFLDSATALTMDLWVMLSSCVPATHLETNGGGAIEAPALEALRSHPRALGLAEMMNMPGVLSEDPGVLAKLAAFAGMPIDGHAPLLSGRALEAYASTGISSCHESSRLEEAREKLRLGISVWMREGSVAKDLETLWPLLTLGSSTSVGFCTDDRNPLDILTEGHVDHLVRRTLRSSSLPSEVVYRSASWSVARHYGLDRGLNRVGAVAPGYQADLVVLSDAKTVAIERVFKRGLDASEIQADTRAPADLSQTLLASMPETHELIGPSGRVHVIEVLEGKILTERSVDSHDAPGVARLTVLERHGKGLKPANAYARGFGGEFSGAIASSVGHDSHNLIVVGKDPSDMRLALASLIECGGGFSVVQGGKLLARLPLPFGGLMSQEEPEKLKRALEELKIATRAIGCKLHEPFLQLAFLSLPVIPSLKLTDRGLVDVQEFKIISVAAAG